MDDGLDDIVTELETIGGTRMNVTLSTNHLRPATMAAMLADLLDAPLANKAACMKLLAQLEACVGVEMSIEWLTWAGVTPEQLAGVEVES